MAFVDEFAEFFPDTITGQPGALDDRGDWVASGSAVTYPARYELVLRNVSANGQTLVSSMSVFVQGAPGFRPDSYRFTIPSRFVPNTDLKAIAVLKEDDEDGPCYEEVLLP